MFTLSYRDFQVQGGHVSPTLWLSLHQYAPSNRLSGSEPRSAVSMRLCKKTQYSLTDDQLPKYQWAECDECILIDSAVDRVGAKLTCPWAVRVVLPFQSLGFLTLQNSDYDLCFLAGLLRYLPFPSPPLSHLPLL